MSDVHGVRANGRLCVFDIDDLDARFIDVAVGDLARDPDA